MLPLASMPGATMRNRPFPRDAIEASAARLTYGLDGATYSKLATELRAWRLGSAVFHSASELHSLIRKSARFERSNVSHENAA